MSPDNKDIALVHLSQNIPQRIINLGAWEFVSFVNGNLMHSHSGDLEDTSQQILFLVKHPRTEQMKLVYIQADPWKFIS